MRGMLRHLNAFFAAAVVCALMMSFGVHAVQVEHQHYEKLSAHDAVPHTHAHDETATDIDLVFLGEQMHLADKKLFVFVAVLSLFALSVFMTSWQDRLVTECKRISVRWRRVQVPLCAFASYLEQQFSIGQLNPKLY